MKSKISREDIINLIIEERLRQLGDPNTLNDRLKTKNDWTATIGYYLFETASRPEKHVTFEDFRESLIKAAAVIVAALETSFDLENNNIIDLLSKIRLDEDEQ